MGDTPRLNFPYIVSSNILDALVQPVIEGALVNTPPASPAAGVLYVVGRSPNGAWTGKAECLAQYVNDVWTFYVPFEGLTAWNKASKSRWYYSGTEWSELSDDQHGKRTDNPHKVTVAQLGAETPSGAQAKANAVQTNLTAHINSGTHKWSSITDKPGTLKDYGIGDTYTKTEADSYREEAKTQIGAEQSELGVEIKGRTLVNLLGKDGNFEVDSNGDGVADGWFAGNLSVRTLENTAQYGNKSQRIASSVSDTQQSRSITRQVPLTANKYYIFLIDMVTDGTSQYILRTQWDSAGTSANSITQKGNKTAFMKFHPVVDFNGYVAFYNWNAVGVAGWVQGDGARLYEITQAEYNAIDSMTEAQVAVTYPYVDSVQFKKDVLVTQIGKNLIPAFNSGEWTLHANAVVNSAYSITVNYDTTNANTNYVDVNVIPNKQYSVSIALAKRLAVTPFNTDGVTFGANLVARNDVTDYISQTFTIPSWCTKIRVHLSSNSVIGVYTYTNPQLEPTSTATTFEPQVKSYAHTPMQIAQDESVWLTPNTSVYKEVWKKNVVLDGSLGWSYNVLGAGFKEVCITNRTLSLGVADSVLIKYNGMPLKSMGNTGSATTEDKYRSYVASNLLLIGISNLDSGWSEAMIPTTSEVRAFFHGWKMCASDGGTYVSGTKYWKKITDGTGITSTLPTASYAGYTPYILHYKLATPIYHINYYNNDPTKPIMSAGSVVNIPQGVTQIEQKSGVVWREITQPSLNSATYFIDGASNVLSKRIKALAMPIRPGTWIAYNQSGAGNISLYGLLGFQMPATLYDSTATYTVTYEQLDKHLYNVDTFAIDNPVSTRQRNFALDSTEQKIAYFKINNVDLVGATGVKNPSTLTDYGILDAYTKTEVDTKDTSLSTLMDTKDTAIQNWAKSFGLGEITSNNIKIDANACWPSGIYYVSNLNATLGHLPTGVTDGQILTMAHSSGYSKQILIEYGGQPIGRIFQRGLHDQLWTSWREIPNESWLNNAGLGTLAAQVSDCNAIANSGFYRISANGSWAGHTPTSNGWWFIIHISHGDGAWAYQQAIGYGGSTGTQTEIWIRHLVAGVWTSWTPIQKSDRGSLLDYSNWNQAKYPGTYLVVPEGGIFGTTGAPTYIYQYGQLVVTNTADTSIQQVYYAHNGPICTRQSFDGGANWNPWQRKDPQAFGIGGPTVLLDGIDINSIVETGFYNCSASCTHTPITGRWWYLTVMQHHTNIVDQSVNFKYAKQIAYILDGPESREFHRTLINNVWTDWIETFNSFNLPPGCRQWTSNDFTPAASTLTSVAHGLPLDPVKCRCDVLLKCVTAQGNYSVGDFAINPVTSPATSNEFPLVPSLDATNIRVYTGSNGIWALNKTTGASFQLTLANWRFVFRIWY